MRASCNHFSGDAFKDQAGEMVTHMLCVTISPAMRSRTKPEKWLHNTGAKIDPEMDPQIAPEAQQTQHNAHNTHTHTT